MKIAVTGANGYIGKHVLEASKKTNHPITTQKNGYVVNIGRAHLCASLGELSSEHAVFNI